MHTSPDSGRLKLLFDVLHDHIEFYMQVGDSELEHKTRKHILDVILTAVRNGVPKELNRCVKKEFRVQRRALGGNLVSKKDKIKYLEEFFSYDFAKIKNYDRYIAHMDLNGDDEETTIIKVNMNVDKDEYTDPVIVDDYSKTVIANKHFYLGKDYVPKNLVEFPEGYAKSSSYVAKGEKEAVDAAISMINSARSEGYDLRINSAYRSYDDQVDIYDSYLKLYGQTYVDNYVSKPGFSEHQTGYAFDFASGNSSVFANSAEYQWMIKNSYKYGFVYRFLRSKEEITEIKHEAWHFRYVGKEIAEVMDKKELCYEEYYAMYLDK